MRPKSIVFIANLLKLLHMPQNADWQTLSQTLWHSVQNSFFKYWGHHVTRKDVLPTHLQVLFTSAEGIASCQRVIIKLSRWIPFVDKLDIVYILIIILLSYCKIHSNVIRQVGTNRIWRSVNGAVRTILSYFLSKSRKNIIPDLHDNTGMYYRCTTHRKMYNSFLWPCSWALNEQ